MLRDVSRLEERAERRCQHRAGNVIDFLEYPWRRAGHLGDALILTADNELREA